MRVRHWLRPPRQLLVVFLVVALVSAAALGWLGWLLLKQDAALDVQRRQEALEQAADRAAAAMQRSISDLQTSTAATLPSGVVALSIGPRDIVVRRGGALLYYPVRFADAPLPPDVFAEAERLEFIANDLGAAATAYASVASRAVAPVRAVALSRLARVRRKLHDVDGALEAYDTLSSLDHVVVDELPSGLVARIGRASLFEETQRNGDLRREAQALRQELAAGRWHLLQPEYDFYSTQLGAWLGTKAVEDRDARVRAEAAAWLWANRASLAPNLRRSLSLAAGAAIVIAQPAGDRLNAVVAGSSYFAGLCSQTVPRPLQCAMTDPEGRTVTGAAPPARMTAVRTAAAAGLPWTLHVSAPADAALGASSPRRPLLLSVLAVVTLVLIAGWYFIVRAMAREARVSRLQSDFVAAVSHEFRSPLTSLSHIAEILAADRIRTDDDRRRSYALLVRETDRLRRLVEDLLEFGRLEAGAATLKPEPADIAALLRTTVADFRQRAALDGYTIELSSAAEGGIYAHADKEALSRALWNLLDNAVKYSPDCRTVWVDLTHDAVRVSIVVRDQGFGIPAHEQREIFDRFARGAESKARRIKGTGIGLAMVREIVRAHGGEVHVSSEPGRGSRFTIALPLSKSPVLSVSSFDEAQDDPEPVEGAKDEPREALVSGQRTA